VQALAKLIGIVGAMRAALARDHDAGGRDACEAGKADQLPWDAHPHCVGYGA